MGVYINMEMPKPGEVIRIYNNGEARRCHVTEQEAFEVGIAIPVPEPHGRLIEEDALKETIEALIEKHLHGYTKSTWDFVCELRSIISDAPTVIPASEKEE